MDFSVLSEKEARKKMDAGVKAGGKELKETVEIVADLTDATRDEVYSWYYAPGDTAVAIAYDMETLHDAVRSYKEYLLLNTPGELTVDEAAMLDDLIVNGILRNSAYTVMAIEYAEKMKAERMEDVERQLEKLSHMHTEYTRQISNLAEIKKAYKN